jgi:uncharacterized protein YjbI with pentapeptide repeats
MEEGRRTLVVIMLAILACLLVYILRTANWAALAPLIALTLSVLRWAWPGLALLAVAGLSGPRFLGLAARVWGRGRWPWLVVALIIITVGLVVGSLLLFPSYLVQRSMKAAGIATLAPSDRVTAENNARTTLLQGLAGLVLVVGAGATWIQIRINRQGHLTERFNTAIAHLGEGDQAKVDMRIGGIYALERLANNSNYDRAAIAELLTDFVCSHATWIPPAGNVDQQQEQQEVAELRARAPDVQAAMTVLGRRQLPLGGASLLLLLGGVDLRKANLIEANLEGADLSHAHLEGADLTGASLRGARLAHVHLEGACLRGANLEGAYLYGADLEGADLTHASLISANLKSANLRKAVLLSANLKRIYIHEANLEMMNLRDAHLENLELPGAKLRDSDLGYAHLQYVNLTGANLTGMNFTGADLRHAILKGAYLQGACLYGAHLKDAQLDGAHLESADLHSANLARADLRGTHLDGVTANRATRWPKRFDWRSAGVHLADESAPRPPLPI